MINLRLFDQYNIDTKKNLDIQRICSRPFDTLLIDRRGSCYACECTAWLPQSVGNLQLKTLEQILNSDVRQHLQESVSDGTYRYCNEHQCPFIETRMPHRKMSDDLRELRLAIDESCNLRCPSCRTALIFHKEGSAFNTGIRLADKINNWLQNYNKPIRVHIGSDGDPFASHIYRHFMENTPVRDNIKYSILTNGLMFEDYHHKVPHVIKNVQELGVSIDGATEKTYEKLRLGGNWEKINRNLECIAKTKMKNKFRFVLHMVVQQDNWREMSEMLKLGYKYGVDKVNFNMIQDWNTNIDFTTQTFKDLNEYKTLYETVKADPTSNVLGLL